MDDNNLIERELSSEKVFSGKVVNLRVDTVALPNEHVAKREYVEHSGGAAILAVDNDRNAYFVRQFRYPYREILTEIPAGKLEPGEAPIEAAKRELHEETGLSGDVQPFGVLYPTPGYTNEKLYIFLATNLTKMQANPDEDEFLAPLKLPLSDAITDVLNGKIKDAKTCYALLKYHALHSPEKHNS